MRIQIYQIISILIYGGFGFLIWKVKNTKIKIFLTVVIFLIFVANPIRLTQEGGARLERNISKFEEIPKKEIVRKDTFETKQKAEMLNLKSYSENLKDEIHN